MKDILVAVSGPNVSSDGALTVAARLAKTLGARLTAVYAPPPVKLSPFALYAGGPALVADVSMEQQSHTSQVRERTAATMASLGLDFEWIEGSGGVVDALTRCAHRADLVVVSRNDPNTVDGLLAGDLADLVIESGRPVLVVPPQFDGRVTDGKVIVGWNGSRGSTRAVHDALPILRVARCVELLGISITAAPQAGGDGSPSICDHLGRHGVDAQIRFVTPNPAYGVDIPLLAEAGDDVNLIVIGAFGRSRLREIALGSVTKSIVERAEVPVLLSF